MASKSEDNRYHSFNFMAGGSMLDSLHRRIYRRVFVVALTLTIAGLTSGVEAAEPAQSEASWEFWFGPRVGVTLTRAEGFFRNPRFDERSTGFGLLAGPEFLWRFQRDEDSFGLGLSATALWASRTVKGTYGHNHRSEPVDESFWVAELHTMVRLYFPTALASLRPLVGVGLFSYAPFGADLGQTVWPQFFSPQFTIGIESEHDFISMNFEFLYQRSWFLPFSSDDGFQNDFDGFNFSMAFLF